MDAERNGVRTFGALHFGTADLGDQRRTQALVRTADEMTRHPGGTLPQKLDKARLKSTYRLMNREEVTHEAVRKPHRERTLELMRACPDTVLVLHDTTLLDYSGLTSVTDLGPIGDGNGRGFLCHNCLAVRAVGREPLGLANQVLVRPPKRKKRKETRKQRRQRSTRLSRRWKQASEAIPAAPAGQRWVDVADREADLLEFLDYEEAQGKQYLVRSKHNRRMALAGDDGVVTVKLHDWVRTLPAQGEKTISVAARENQPKRNAKLSVAWTEVQILPPQQPRGEGRNVPLRVWVLRVWEAAPPAGCEALEWILLTNVPVATWDDAWERLNWYETRWVVEEYHKGMKTGCGVETLQFTTVEALEPAIALLSVVTLWLFWLRLQSMLQ